MATVPNKADFNAPVDKPLTKHNRTSAGAPSFAPLYSGEIVLDTTTHGLWQAQSLANDSWVSYQMGSSIID